MYKSISVKLLFQAFMYTNRKCLNSSMFILYTAVIFLYIPSEHFVSFVVIDVTILLRYIVPIILFWRLHYYCDN